MRNASHASHLLLLVAATALCGCGERAPKQQAMTLDELYSMSDRVNATAQPHDLGTGDSVGTLTHAVHRADADAAITRASEAD